MIKNKEIKKSLLKRVIMIVGIILATPVVLVILLVGLYFGTKPIFEKIDHDKFVTLDTQMQNVYHSLITASRGDDDWKYITVCSSNMSGWMRNGTYNCVVSISTQKIVTSVDEISNLQAKYYPIVDSSQFLKQTSELDLGASGDFGKRFVVGSAEKNYSEIKSGIGCNYSILLYQSIEHATFSSDSYGSAIVSGKARAIISLRCVETARNSWYTLVQNTSSIIPE